jgi:beta-glucanase (GH16 family)
MSRMCKITGTGHAVKLSSRKHTYTFFSLALGIVLLTPLALLHAQDTLTTGTPYNIVNENSSSCVDATNEGTANGTTVQQWACGEGTFSTQANQQWVFTSAGNGFYEVTNVNAPSEAWNVTNNGTTIGSLMQLWTYAGNPNEEWQAVSLSNGFYKFVGQGSGLCLDTPGASTANGVQLDIYTCNGTAAQAFKLVTPAPSTGGTGNCSGVSNMTVGSTTYTPQWCQEFNGSAGSPDTTAWNFDLGNNGGWGNNEVEVYCGPPGYPGNPSLCPTTFSTSTSPVYMDGNGHLVIQPRNIGGTWISGRMNTEGKQNFQYGILEASIQAPDTTNQGLWPAFWTLGSDISTVPWPSCGEADIMELWTPQIDGGSGPGGNHSTIHTAVTGSDGLGQAFSFPSGEQNDTAFHTYGIVWSPNLIELFVDNASTPFFTVTPSSLPSGDTWPFNANLFALLNVAVGGTLGGSTSGLTNPQPMIVDYVRWYTAQ